MRMLVILVALGSCKDASTSKPIKNQTPFEKMKDELLGEAVRGPGFSIAPTPLPVASTAAGPAYMFVKNVGLVSIAVDGSVQLVPLAMELTRIVLAPDGAVLALSVRHDTMLIRGTAIEKAGPPTPEVAQHVAMSPEGVPWFADFTTVYRLANGAWEVMLPASTDEKNQVSSIDFDGKGHVYVTRFRDVVVRDGDSWKPVFDTTKLANGSDDDKPYWHRSLVTPSGELWILSDRFLVRSVGGKAVISELPDTMTFDSRGVGRFVGANLVAFGPMRSDLMSITPTGAMTSVAMKRVERAGSYEAEIDGRGRAWTWDPGTGLSITTPDGMSKNFPNGSIPEINADIESMAIAGTGPDALPKTVEIARGTIAGRVMDHDVAVDKAPVEICRKPRLKFSGSPCAGALDQLVGTTDAEGNFAIEAPLQTYRVVTKIGADWYTLFEKECSGIATGGTCSFGTLDVKNKL